MPPKRSRTSKGSTHPKLRSHLRTFRPADAAFVFHLTQCQRCRNLAERLVAPDETASIDSFLASLSPIERDFVLDLTRGGYLLSMAQAPEPQNDLSPMELQAFLESLRPEQAKFIRHLLGCPGCQGEAARALAPRDQPDSSLLDDSTPKRTMIQYSNESQRIHG